MDNNVKMLEYKDEEGDVQIQAKTTQVAEKKFNGALVSNWSFSDFLLKPVILQALDDYGLEHPSEVQHKWISQAVLGMDIMCQEKSRTGKTVLFVLATLQQLELTKDHMYVLVLCHTAELASQIDKQYERFAKYIPELKVAVFCENLPIQKNEETLKTIVPHIVIGTPERIVALIRNNSLNCIHLKHFVLVESDKMLKNLVLRREVQNIFRSTPRCIQVMIFGVKFSKEIAQVCRNFVVIHGDVAFGKTVGELEQSPAEAGSADLLSTTVNQLEQTPVDAALTDLQSTTVNRLKESLTDAGSAYLQSMRFELGQSPSNAASVDLESTAVNQSTVAVAIARPAFPRRPKRRNMTIFENHNIAEQDKLIDCWNCYALGHIAKDCDQPQRFTRCPVCNNMCTRSSSHKMNCSNKTFVSQLIEPTADDELPNQIFELSFIGVNGLSAFIKGGGFCHSTDDDQSPINLPQIKSKLTFPSINQLRCYVVKLDQFFLVINDKEGVQACRLVFQPTFFVVDNRVKISLDGLVSYQLHQVRTYRGPVHFKLQCHNVDVDWTICINFAGNTYKLRVYGLRGAFLVDPQLETVLSNIVAEAIAVKNQDEGNNNQRVGMNSPFPITIHSKQNDEESDGQCVKKDNEKEHSDQSIQSYEDEYEDTDDDDHEIVDIPVYKKKYVFKLDEFLLVRNDDGNDSDESDE